MNKIIFLKNNIESKICFYFLKKHEGSQYNDYYCLRYNKYCTDNKRYRQEITNMISDFGDCDNFYYRICEDIYLLNESDLDIDEVVERISKYFNKSDIVTFSDEDFAKFKEQCKFLAEKMGLGKLNNLDDYVDYLSDLDLDDCYAQKEDGEDDYDTQLIYCLLEPFCNMLKEKGVEYK